MYRKLCIAVRITTSVSHIMYRILLYRISCIAFHVSHILYRITHMQGHGGPRGATGGHGEAQKKPWNNTGGHGGPQPAAKKSGHTPRGATGGHGGPRGATAGSQKVPQHQPPPSISSRTPTSCACLGNVLSLYTYGHVPRALFRAVHGQKGLRPESPPVRRWNNTLIMHK